MSSYGTPYRDHLMQALANKDEAAAYLSAALEDSPEAFRTAFKNVSDAQAQSGGTHGLASVAPELDQAFTVEAISEALQSLGLHLTVAPEPIEVPEAA